MNLYFIKRLAVVAFIGSFFSPAVLAATIDFTNAGGSGGYGNSINFSQGGIGVNAKGWAETGAETPPGSDYFLLQTAQVYSWSTGLGICNRSEGLAGSGCSDNEHEVDTVSRDDLLVLYFDQIVNFEFLTVDPYNGSGSDPNDRDIIYWVGTVGASPNLASNTFDTLDLVSGVGSEILSAASSSFNPYTHALSGTGNLIMISGNYHDLNCKNKDVTQDIECEAYKVSNITVSAIPVPAAVWLFGSGLLSMAALARRRRQKA